MAISNRVLRSHRNPPNERVSQEIPQEDDSQYFDIFNCNLQENLDFSLSFEQFQMNLQINSCSICNEIDLQLTSSVCNRCSRYPHPNRLSSSPPTEQVNPFSELNNMQPGEIPDELKGLSILEQSLIAPIKPFMMLFKLQRNGQWKYNGNCISFNQDITELVTEIPRTLDSLSELVIIRRPTDDVSQFSQVRVRKRVIYRAIQWLLSHNSLYRSKIQFNQNNLDSLPDDENVGNRLQTIFTEENTDNQTEDENQIFNEIHEDIDYSSAMNFEVPNIRRQVDRILNNQRDSASNLPVLNMPNVFGSPVNESTNGLWALAFPCLFPYGLADFNQGRLVEVSLSDWIKHLLKLKSGAFARDPRFRYMALNIKLRHQMMLKARVYVQKNSAVANMQPDELRQALAEDQTLYRNVLSYGSSVPSTPSFWFARKNELQSMIENLRTPTIFFTLSAADHQWPELFRLLEQYSERGPYQNEFQENMRRNKLINENPLITVWFFKLRVTHFIENVLFKKFNVRDHWFRYEAQHRGSLHIHGFMWFEDAPNVDNLSEITDEEREEIIKYFDRIVSCTNLFMDYVTNRNSQVNPCKIHLSAVVEHDMYTLIEGDSRKNIADYQNLINTFQRHTVCGRHCLRKEQRTGNEVCRYKYPKPLRNESSLIRQENGRFKFEIKRNDSRINQHNPSITSIYRANTDFTPVISPDDAAHYLAKYASKDEPSSMAFNNVQAVLNSVTINSNVRSFIQSLLMKQVGIRDYSAQECLFILLDFKLFDSSRKFVLLFLTNDNFIPIRENQETVERNQVEAYANRVNNFRPANRPGNQAPELEEQHIQNELQNVEQASLFVFYSNYYKRTIDSDNWSKYRTKRIVRVFPRLKFKINQNNDEFFKQQLKLHVPWSQNFEESINPNALPWAQVYRNYSDLIPNHINLDEIEIEEDDLEEIEQENDHDNNLEDFQIYLRMHPNTQRIDAAELGLREQDNVDWTANYSNYNIDQCSNFINTHIRTELEQQVEFPNVAFSDEQVNVLNTVRSMVSFVETGQMDQNFKRSLIIQGKAGSGKSLLIETIKAILTQRLGSNSFKVMAPTGSAANNIKAQTIHSGLKINIEKKLKSLLPQPLHDLQEDYQHCKFLIIDEMSLIGCSLLRKIDIRSREAKSDNANEPFGGMFLILFGDLKQLPPVFDRPFYGTGFTNQYSDLGQRLFRDIEASIILTTSFRQQEDQQRFRDILDRLSNGQTTIADWQTLNQRALSNLSQVEQTQFNNSLHLCDTSEKANSINYEKLRAFNAVYRIEAINSSTSARNVPSRLAGNLENILYLAVGCRVILRKNLWVAGGLVNGSIRTIKDIVVQPDGHQMPLFVMVEFDNYNGPTINGAVPIVPTQSSWISDNQECTRIQIPLCVAYAITIHKSQGMSLERAVVSLGDREWQLGLAYVALSRVRTLNGLALDKECNYNRLSKIRENHLLALRLAEEDRLRRISL